MTSPAWASDRSGGGSWYVESRTEQLAHMAWQIFTDIERARWRIASHSMTGTSRYWPRLAARAGAIAHRRDPITGVSEFAFPRGTMVRTPGPVVTDRPILPSIRYAEEFETLRDRAESGPSPSRGLRGRFRGRRRA